MAMAAVMANVEEGFKRKKIKRISVVLKKEMDGFKFVKEL